MREFHSFGEAAAHLLTIHLESQREALDRAAAVVQKEAKSLIGEYQPANSPFAAWAELADATKEDRASQGFPDNEPLLRTGEMRDSIKRVASNEMAVVGSNEDKAVYQEMGTAKIPPRSFLGMAAMNKRDEIGNILGRSVMGMLVEDRAFMTKISPP